MNKQDLILSGQQAVNRHYLLSKIEDDSLQEILEEQKEIVSNIENGIPVNTLELKLFIEDTELLWETYNK